MSACFSNDTSQCEAFLLLFYKQELYEFPPYHIDIGQFKMEYFKRVVMIKAAKFKSLSIYFPK